METENGLHKELRGIAQACLERLKLLLTDESMETKELVSISKEARAMAELVDELEPTPPVQNFHLKLTIEDGSV